MSITEMDVYHKDNPSFNHIFSVGDHVRVVKKGHKRYGSSGVINKQTRCYVYYQDDNTNNTVQIHPSALALHVVRTTEEISPGSTSQYAKNFSSRPNSSTIAFAKPDDFPIQSSVTVVDTHPKHGGKVGVVRDQTTNFVLVIFKNDIKEVRISPRFLRRNMRLNSSNEYLSAITTLPCTEADTDDDMATGYQRNTIRPRNIIKEFESQLVFGEYSVEKICLQKSIDTDSAFVKIWGTENYLKLEFPLDVRDPNLPLTENVLGKEYTLFYAEVDDNKSRGSVCRKVKKVTAYYVKSSMEDLRKHEDRLGNFGILPPNKIWARRKHFLSPAMKLVNKEYAVKPIAANDVTMIDDVGTGGCGFISEQYLEELLGNRADAKRALGIQVRLFIPTKGVFKGMLMRKRNVIGEPIQLNASLMKVGPSRRDDASDVGYIVIKISFPSSDNFIIGRLFQDQDALHKQKLKPITEVKGFVQSLRKDGKSASCKLSEMYIRVWEGLGVPDETIKQYVKEYKQNPDRLCHAHVVGMADPTCTLPANSVFLTGTKDGMFDEIFVSRSPCMEAKDGRMIKLVKTRPGGMPDDEWDWLQSLAFGALIFGNPRPGDRPLPELIADGDLDGDLYFVCWDQTILSYISYVPITSDELLAPLNSISEKEYKPDWFSKTQRFISQIPTLHYDIDQLVGMCYKKSVAISDIRDLNAVSFARAYKQALDMKKHGKPVILRGGLWEEVPDRLHKYLAPE